MSCGLVAPKTYLRPWMWGVVPGLLLAIAVAPAVGVDDRSHSARTLQLTAEEQVWLAQHPVITFGVNDFPPLIFSNHGEPTGIGVEYVALIAQRLGIKARWISYPSWGAEIDALHYGRLDVAATMASERAPVGLLSSEPWMFLKAAIVTRRTAPAITGIHNLAGEIIAAQRISPGEMEIRQRFPAQKLLVTESVGEMLDDVVDGRAAAGVGMLAIIDYAMRNKGYGDSLKLAAPFGERDVPVRMLVRTDATVLQGILDKAIAGVSGEQLQTILGHWFVPSLQQGLDPARVFWGLLTVGLPMLALTACVIYWVFRLRREVRWRKAAQRRVTDITDSVPGIVFEFVRADNGAYSVPFVSGSMQELLGLTREAVIDNVGRYFAQVLPEDIDDYLAAIERSWTGGGRVQHSFRIKHAVSNEIRWLTVHATAPRMENGCASWRGYVVDITEQKRLEGDLAQALERAKSAERAKSEFLANMSHEIRTPMNAIIGMNYLLQQTDLSSRQFNYVSKVDAAARSLLTVINDTLDFSKIEAGKLTLESLPFSLRALFDNLTTMLGQRAQAKGLELLFDIDSSLPDVLVGDTTRLSQILVNLCSNAVKFTATGEIIVSACALDSNDSLCAIRFAVKDTGIGVAPEQMSRLFQPFQQADASTTRLYGGTGLGLTIAKRLCEMMGGEIGVDSAAGRGSTFWFVVRLPAAPGAEALSTAAVDGMRLLIADDNAAARAVLLTIATSLKLKATAVASGEKAVMALQQAQTPYDIVLFDWEMSGLSGPQLVREIRKKGGLSRVPRVILATACHGSEGMLKLGETQTDGLLVKPITASTLLDAMQRALGRQAAIASLPARETVVSRAPDLKGRRILLVEDNDINREVAIEVLRLTGATVVVAGDGREAVLAARSEHVDCVLMDIQMPVMDGEAAARAIRSDLTLRDLPIIAMTASGLVGDRERFLAAGMNDHVVKPIAVPELFAALSRWMPNAEPRTAQAAGEATLRIDDIDTEQALARLNGDRQLYMQLLAKFKHNHAGALDRIRAALLQGDRQTAARESHMIAGVSGNLGATALCEAAQAVEASSRTDSTVAATELQALESLMATFLQRIEQATEQLRGVAAAPADACPPVAALLGQLRSCVDDCDGAAADSLQALQGVLGEDRRIAEIGRHLGRYDFAAAGVALQQLESELEFTVTHQVEST